MINRILTLERRTRAQPHDPSVWCELAEARLQDGQRVEALAAAEAAAQSRIETAEQWIRIGDLFRALDLGEHARQMYLDACQRDRGSALAHLRLGESLLAEGNADDAANLFATAVWLAPDDPVVRIAEARALIALESQEEAREQLMTVVEAHPEQVAAWGLLADLHLARGESAQAFAALRKGSAAAPGDRDIGFRLGQLLLDAGFTRDAITVLGALAGHHSDPEVLDLLAEAHIRAGDRTAAVTTLRQRRQKARDAVTAARLGELLREAEQYEEAIPLLTEALAGASDSGVYVQLGQALLATGRAERAMDVAEYGIARFGEERGLVRLLGKARAAAGDDDDAEADRSLDVPMLRPESAFAGNIKQFKVVDLLEFLRLNQRTGTLRLIWEGRMGEVLLHKGKLAGVSTSDAARVGDLLVRGGHLSAADLEHAIRLQQERSRPAPLGQVLIENAMIDEETLRPVLDEQIQAAIGDIMRWTDGHFAFEADDGAVEAPSILFDTAMMMLDALRLEDEEAWNAR